MKRTNFHVTEQQLEKLSAESERTGLSHSEIVRRAIDLYFGDSRAVMLDMMRMREQNASPNSQVQADYFAEPSEIEERNRLAGEQLRTRLGEDELRQLSEQAEQAEQRYYAGEAEVITLDEVMELHHATVLAT